MHDAAAKSAAKSTVMFQSNALSCDTDILTFDVPDVALEKAAAAIPGGAMSFPNAPTVSILVICCSFND